MALTDSIGSVIGGFLKKGPAGAPDLTPLFNIIDNAGEQQKEYINQLPVDLQQQYAAYKASNAATGNTLQTSVDNNNTDYLDKMSALYDPNSPAVKASQDAAKTSIYADLPSQQAAIREALAATGGFSRGTAAKQLAAPVLQAGAKLDQANLNISADQLQKQQAAKQQAITTVNSIDDATANTLFGMSKDQALQILNNGRADLQNQLTELINQSQTQTNQKLQVSGQQIQNQYNQTVADNADYNNKVNGWVNLGTNVASAAPGFLSGLNAPAINAAPANYAPNIAPNQTANLGY